MCSEGCGLPGGCDARRRHGPRPAGTALSSEAVEQWKALSRRFPELDDIVDRTHMEEEITASEMRRRLLRLYHAYVAEWNVVENALEAQFEQKTTPRPLAHASEAPIQQTLLCR